MEGENTSLTSLFLQGLASKLFLFVVLACLKSLTQQKSFCNMFLWGMQWSSQPTAMLKGLGYFELIMSFFFFNYYYIDPHLKPYIVPFLVHGV